MAITKTLFENRNLRWALYGALLFWTPDTLIHAIERNAFDNILLVSVLCPLVVIVGYFVLAFFSPDRISTLHPGFVLLGIWWSGGLATMVASSSAGAGFVTAGWGAVGISLAAIIFPPFTAMLATYDGTLGALFLITLLMGLEMAVQLGRVVQIRFSRVGA